MGIKGGKPSINTRIIPPITLSSVTLAIINEK